MSDNEAFARLCTLPYTFEVQRRRWLGAKGDVTVRWLVTLEWWRWNPKRGYLEKAFITRGSRSGNTLAEAVEAELQKVRCEVCKARGADRLRKVGGADGAKDRRVCAACEIRPEAECAAKIMAAEARAKAKEKR